MNRIPTLIAGLVLAASSCADSGEGSRAPKSPTSGTGDARVQRLVIDIRDPEAFAAGHDPGALNLQWGWDQLEGRVRSYLPDRSRAIALRAESPERARQGMELLEKYGYSDVEILEGAAGHETLPLMTAEELARRIAAGDAPTIIDVRTPGEWSQGVIEGAITVEQDDAPGLVDELDPQKEYAIICAGGYRSSQLASLLRSRGFTRVSNVIDGMSAWYRR